MQLCAQLGLRRVLLLAHADACLLALRAASRAAEQQAAMLQEALAALPIPQAAGGVNSSMDGGGGGGGGGGFDDDGRESLDTEDLAALAAEVDEDDVDGCCGNGIQPHTTLTVHPEAPYGGGNILRRRNASAAAFPPPQSDMLSPSSSLTEALHLGGGGGAAATAGPASADSTEAGVSGQQAQGASTSDPFCSDASVAAAGPDSPPTTTGRPPTDSSSSVPPPGANGLNRQLGSIPVSSFLAAAAAVGLASNGGSNSHRSLGFEGPDALAAASYALGLLPSGSVEGDSASPSPHTSAVAGGQLRSDIPPTESGAGGLGSSASAGPSGWGSLAPHGVVAGINPQQTVARGWTSRHRRALSVPYPG